MRKFYVSFCLAILCLGIFAWKNGPTPYTFPSLRYFPKMPVNLENPTTVEGAHLGRLLFYDRSLSFDSSMSCATCHQQAFAFSDAPKEFSIGRDSVLMKRNTMPLFNLAWYPSYFWDGRAASIEEQISFPLHADGEMKVDWTKAVVRIQNNPTYANLFSDAFQSDDIDSNRIKKAIAQFLRTLISYQSKYDEAIFARARLNKDEYAGFVLMNDQTKGDCLHCHTTDANMLGTTLKFSNNGLDAISDPKNYKDKGLGGHTGKENQNGLFKIPSLRNVAVTAPYMHDGRFKTLEEVLDFYSSGVHASANVDSKMEFVSRGGADLSAEEKMQIIAFLKTMTDSVFLTNPEFSNPFLQK